MSVLMARGQVTTLPDDFDYRLINSPQNIGLVFCPFKPAGEQAHALELGAGCGRNLALFHARGYQRIVAMDYDKAGFRTRACFSCDTITSSQRQKDLNIPGLSIQNIDVLAADLDSYSFHLVVAIDLFRHLPESGLERLSRQINECIAEGGRLIVRDWQPACPELHQREASQSVITLSVLMSLFPRLLPVHLAQEIVVYRSPFGISKYAAAKHLEVIEFVADKV